MNDQQGPAYCITQGTLLNVMWQSEREGSLGANGYMGVCGWVPLLFTWKHCNIATLHCCSYAAIQNKKFNREKKTVILDFAKCQCQGTNKERILF